MQWIVLTCSGMEQVHCYHYHGDSACQRVVVKPYGEAESVQQLSRAHLI